MTERLLTTRQVADLLALSPETVLRRYRAGELPGYRIASNVLRFRQDEIEAWLEGTRAGAGACQHPRGGVVFGTCGFGPRTFRAMRQNARGLRASGRIAVLGGLRARRERRPS